MSLSTCPQTIDVHIKNIIHDINENVNLISKTNQSENAFITTLVNHTDMNLFIFDLTMITPFTKWSTIEFFTGKKFEDIYKEFPEIQIQIVSLKNKIQNLVLNYFLKLSQYLEKMHNTVEDAIYNFKDDMFLFLFKVLEKSILKENVCCGWIPSKTLIIEI